MVESVEINGIRVFRTLSPSQDRTTKSIVLLHDYGANGRDLIGCTSFFNEASAYQWVFPQAPVSLAGMGYGESWAWFDIDVWQFQNAAVQGKDVVLSPQTLARAEAEVDRLVTVFQSLNLDPAHTVIGGFSQGSMMALLTLLRCPAPWAGMLLFSGASVFPAEWRHRFAALAHKPRVFQSHGHHDAVLSYASGIRLRSELTAAGFRVQSADFEGGHEIPPAVLLQADNFLQSLWNTPR